MSNCLFCKIIEKKLPAKIVYEDDSVIAFEDSDPQAPVHTLVMPRKHIPTLFDLKKEDMHIIGHLFEVAKNVAKNRGIAERGVRLVTNCNPESGQLVYHLHVHLLGGRPMRWPPG